MSEHVIFKDETTKMAVTNYRFIAKNTSYSLKHIVSVSTYNKQNTIPARVMEVTNSEIFRTIRYLIVGAILFCIVAGDLSLIWLTVIGVLSVAFYWFIKKYPLTYKVDSQTYLTYHLDVVFSNGPTFQYVGEDKLIDKLGKALNRSLCENWQALD